MNGDTMVININELTNKEKGKPKIDLVMDFLKANEGKGYELEEIKLGISYTDESKKLSQIMAWAMKKYPCVRSAPHPTDGRRSIYFWQPATE